MCLYIDDVGDATTLASGVRRARKPHACLECRRTIDPGESYWYQTDVDHNVGGIVMWKMCAHCRALIKVGARLAGCPEVWYWEMVLDLTPDYMGFAGDILSHTLPPGARFRFLRLVVSARRKWRDRHDQLVPVPEWAS